MQPRQDQQRHPRDAALLIGGKRDPAVAFVARDGSNQILLLRQPVRFLAAGAVARLILRVPVPALVVAAATHTVFGMTCSKVITDPFDYDMRNLGNTHSASDGAGALYQRVGAIFPLDITPVATVVLGYVAQAPAFRTALLERDCADAEMRKRLGVSDRAAVAAECRRRAAAGEPTGGVIDDVKSILGVLPADQDKKWPVVKEILRLLDDPAVKELDAEQKQQIDEWAPPRDLRPVQAKDVPQLLSLLFRERDGLIGRVVRIFPVPGQFEGWDGRELQRMQEILHDVPLPDGTKVSAAGWTTCSTRCVAGRRRPQSGVLALLGVSLLVVVSFRRPRAIV